MTKQLRINLPFGMGKSAASIALGRALAAERAKALRHLKKAKALAAPHGIVIERERADAYWVTCSKFPDSKTDPLSGNNFCGDGCEVLLAVEAYIEAIESAS